MKIAQLVSLRASVPPKNKNGLEFIAHYLTEELVKRGHEVTLFASADSETSASLQSIFPSETLTEKNIFWPLESYSAFNAFYCFSQAEKFDIIHSHCDPDAMLFSQFTDTPLLTTIHAPINENWLLYTTDQRYYKYLKPIFDVLEKQKRVFVSKSQQRKSYYNKNSSVILNGIPVEEFSCSANPADYFAFFGFLNYDKGAHIAVRTAKKAGVKLKLAGNSTPEFLEKEINPYLDDTIEYIGPVSGEKRVQFLQNAKALLVPIQWDEPFGLVMPEAMACGTPVIAFNRASVPEIIKDKKTGFIVNNEEEMVAALDKIHIIDRAACRKHVEENFTIKRMADEYEKLYEKIIKEY